MEITPGVKCRSVINLSVHMVQNEQLTTTVREALAHLPKVEEKKMFRGITFMVNGKMCSSVGNDELMCRIDPKVFDTALEQNGCRPMIHGKRMMRGFIFISPEGYSRTKDFDYWVGLSLDFNNRAKETKKKN